jgi:hypothetical protein
MGSAGGRTRRPGPVLLSEPRVLAIADDHPPAPVRLPANETARVRSFIRRAVEANRPHR